MDGIWNLLKEYDFLSNNIINIDLVCILCKKILIDARIGPCGCRYCKICIENHLKNGENICPGSTDQCNEEYLNLIENINIGHFMNRKIAKLKLNCPIESCQFSDQIINMKQHLTGCRENAIKCSFCENGCNFISLSGDNVDKHCKMSKDKHLELVVMKIEKINLINNKLNKNEIESQQEIKTIKLVNEKLQIENDKNKNLLLQNQTNINQWKSDYNKLKAENDIQKQEIANYKAKFENEINNKNKLIKYLADYLIGNQTKFVWTIDKFSEMKAKYQSRKCDKFFIFKEEIWMQMSMNYDNYYGRFNLCGKISHHNNLLNICCPLICCITIGIVHEISGNFILSFDEKGTFGNTGIAFTKQINLDQIKDEIINDCLTVKCLINLSSC